jgi:hypothetical protein
MQPSEMAMRVVSSPENLSKFSEHGFKTVDKNRVLNALISAGADPEAALSSARAAVESVGGIVASRERDAGLGGERASWRYIYEVWMVPEDAKASQAA